jgi:hypothetical protein
MNNTKSNIKNNKNNIEKFSTTQEFKPKSYNGFIIAVLTVLYIIFANKIAEMLAGVEDNNENISTYVMMVYFISVMSIVIAYVSVKEINNGNYVIKKSLIYGGAILLIYTLFNYWEYLDDYAKLIMLALAISCIVYYAY